VALVGASGSGKTTLLRTAAGLLTPSGGRVTLDGVPIGKPGPDRAVVFQHGSLWPWRTVAANLELAHRLAGRPADERDDAIAGALERVAMVEFAGHYPHELSGGMVQRVALARALIVSPRILLLDEPFGALDAISRRHMGAHLLRVWEADRRTAVLVTHSIEEAITLADRIVLLRGGRVAADLEVALPRPRDPDVLAEDRAFLDLRRRLWKAL
jgi:NitT/TauT family transport system ATP-binding protein